MKLYQTSMTPSAMRVTLFLKEKGIEIPVEEINVREGDNLKVEFQAISANGRIPLLQLDDGSYLSESIAICRYIDALSPDDKGLFGSDPKQKGLVEMWNRMVELQGLMVGFQAFRNITGIYQDRERVIPEWGEESKLRLGEFLPTLENRLAEAEYLAGEFSIADISLWAMLKVVQALGIEWQSQYPNLQQWHQRLAKRPAFQA
ncbi:glutathione S-transferase family protein [Paraferrimonas sedimenticola]